MTSLQDLFGSNVVETASTIQLSKSDLANITGLTPQSNNFAESIMASIVMATDNSFEGNVVDVDETLIVDETGSPITYDESNSFPNMGVSFWGNNVITRNNQQYKIFTYLVDFYVSPPPDPSLTLDSQPLNPMANPPSLTALFGANATQDSNTITLSKQDLAKSGLQIASNLTAESIYAGLLLTAMNGQDTSADTNMQISPSDQFLITRNNTLYRRYRYTVDFFTVEPPINLNPNNIV